MKSMNHITAITRIFLRKGVCRSCVKRFECSCAVSRQRHLSSSSAAFTSEYTPLNGLSNSRDVNTIIKFNKGLMPCGKLLTALPSLNFTSCRLSSSLSSIEYEEIATETLEALQDYFEKLFDDGCFNDEFDVEYSSGVLTIKVGGNHGTYVINKQTPNKQIWLSSPTSGPKRYDFIDGCWLYSHDGERMHQLLSDEFSNIIQSKLDFSSLPYSSST